MTSTTSTTGAPTAPVSTNIDGNKKVPAPSHQSKRTNAEYFGIVGLLAIVVLLAVIAVLPTVGGFLRVMSALALISLALGSYRRIPSYHYGVVSRMGRRLTNLEGGILTEGGRWILPLLDQVELISTELDRIVIDVSFTTKDNVTIKVNGPLQYRPDPNIMNGAGQNLFIEITEETMCKGIAEEVQAKLGALGGVYNAEDFIQNRMALGSFINAILRFYKAPHLKHTKKTRCGAIIEVFAEKDDEDWPGVKKGDVIWAVQCENDGRYRSGNIGAKDLIAFYNLHWDWVKRQTDNKTRKRRDSSASDADHSPIERRFGIEVEVFNLADVAFGEEMEEALEERKQAELRAGAIKKKIDLAEEVKNRLGADAQVAFNSADVLMTPGVSKHIVSVEGDAGILGGIVAGLTGKKGTP